MHEVVLGEAADSGAFKLRDGGGDHELSHGNPLPAVACSRRYAMYNSMFAAMASMYAYANGICFSAANCFTMPISRASARP